MGGGDVDAAAVRVPPRRDLRRLARQVALHRDAVAGIQATRAVGTNFHSELSQPAVEGQAVDMASQDVVTPPFTSGGRVWTEVAMSSPALSRFVSSTLVTGRGAVSRRGAGV